MAEKNMQLRGAIYSRYKTEAECAKALHWQRQRLNKITNGVKEPTVTEVCDMANVLELDIGTVANFFIN